MDGTEDAWRTAARLHLIHGTTGMTPTTLSATREELLRAFQIIHRCRDPVSPMPRLARRIPSQMRVEFSWQFKPGEKGKSANSFWS